MDDGPRTMNLARWLVIVLAAAVACASPTADEAGELQPYLDGPAQFEEAWQERPDPDERREQILEMIAEPVDMETAVRIALLNNPALRADIAEVGIRSSMLRQETVLANPRLDTELYFSQETAGIERVDAGLHIDLTSIFSRAARARAASAGTDSARAQAAGRVVSFIAEVRRAWIDYVAAGELLEHQQLLFDAVRADAESARIYHDAGNIADDELYRAEAFSAQAHQELFRAQEAAVDSEEHLRRLLAVDVDTDWEVAGELPDPPQELPDLDALEEQALQRSIALQQVEYMRDEQTAQMRATRWQGWLPDLSVGVVTDWRGETLEYGPALGVAIPLFDRHQHSRDELRARTIQQDFVEEEELNRIRHTSERISRRLHLRHQAFKQYPDEILPLQERLVEETLRQYNAMNAGIFELLQARRDQLQAQRDHIEARRRFWLAWVDFDHLRSGGVHE